MEKAIERNLEWIQHLDALFTTNASAIYRNNPSFYYYPDVQIEIESDNINIICRKLEDRTRFLFGDCYGRRIYFTDVDIINIIVGSQKKVYDVICDILMLYIKNPITEEVNFKINDQDFYYKSIVGNGYDKVKLEVLKLNSFETTADLNIKYIDLITLISLIINKEFLVDISRGTDRVLRQAKKFLVLSKFYKENKYLVELKSLGYPFEKIEKVYYNSSIAKELDVIFDKITL
ncbi:hypothetical protein JOY40_02660 [Bacillus tropicus]|uniref:hypothetical protein n=1 Tax=Bacillus cereus group TaxID=86661 RepID=UPI0022DED059|nr:MULTISPECIES: hypothetical protein [unclassified Bacillus cereus group]MDA1549323.1 hypothetical protein [Bacillus cereus group sp. TH243-3LC]MDA1563573.1 hypothetical protein [Bacillus cereus group sp. TH243-1LC]